MVRLTQWRPNPNISNYEFLHTHSCWVSQERLTKPPRLIHINSSPPNSTYPSPCSPILLCIPNHCPPYSTVVFSKLLPSLHMSDVTLSPLSLRRWLTETRSCCRSLDFLPWLSLPFLLGEQEAISHTIPPPMLCRLFTCAAGGTSLYWLSSRCSLFSVQCALRMSS